MSLFFSVARADVLLEPIVGSKSNQIVIENGKSGNGDGVGYGARAGYEVPIGHILSWQLGTEYLKTSVKNLGASYDDFNMHEWGVFTGIKFRKFLRFYGGYTFSGQAELYDPTRADWIQLSEVQGTMIGVGLHHLWESFTLTPFSGAKRQKIPFTPLTWITFNLEKRQGTFGSVKNATDAKKIGEYDSILVSLSLQISL